MRKLLIILSIFTLLSCASSSEKVRYYSLTLNETPQLNIIQSDIKNPVIIVEPVILARFLRQQGLVFQSGNYELSTANYNRWAEPLEELIAKKVVQELNQKSSRYHFEKQSGQWRNNVKLHLKLEIEKFHATDASTAIIAGRYWFYEKNMGNKTPQNFAFSKKLTADGYLHTVEKLAQALSQLSEDMLHSISKSTQEN